MKQSIIRGKEGYSSSYIKEIDEQQFHDIVKYVNNLDVDEFDIYENLYKSRYNMFPNSLKKEKLNRVLDSLKSSLIIETNDNKSGYDWIFVKRGEIKDIAYRYYFGINPMNLYDLVEKLTIKFVNYRIPIEFKYQKESKKNLVDRIIMYTDFKNKEKVEKIINEVYKENKELFVGSERPLPWIYESSTPNVYISPESLNHEKSFGEKFAQALMESKRIFHYFYQENRVKDQEQLEFLKKVVLSSLLKHNVLLESTGKRMRTYETNINTFYNKDNNTIKNVIDEKDGYFYEVLYDSSNEAKKAFLKNFYSVKNVIKEPGVVPRVLTREERIKEIYNFLYPNSNNKKK